MFDVEMIVYNHQGGEYSGGVFLHEVGGKRREFILITGWAWSQMMAELEGTVSAFPRCHVAWANTIKAFGASLESVSIDTGSPEEKWFRAELRINREQQAVSITARPSDAIILALNFNIPIFIRNSALR